MAHNNLGNLLKNVRKDYDAAETHYRKSIEHDPKNAYSYTAIGSILKKRKDYDGAEKMYRKAIELNPESPHAYWHLSRLLQDHKNDIPGAIKQMEEYVRLGNDGEQELERLRAKL